MYTYLIGWRELDMWYYGVRTANTEEPESDLWIRYFTSSKFVKALRESHGEPDAVRVHKRFNSREEAVEFEDRFLTRVNAVNSERWLNRCNGGKKFYVEKTQTPEHLRRRRKALKGRRPGFVGKKHSPETKEKMRLSRLAHFEKNGKRTGWEHSPETKEKIAQSRKNYFESLKNAEPSSPIA